MIEINKVYEGDCVATMKTWPDEFVDCVVTSPPYWGLRDYGTAKWIGGSSTCDHREYLGGHGSKSKKQITSSGTQMYNYRDICKKCSAKRIDQQLGNEGTPDGFVQNLVDVFRQIKRILKPMGTVWLVLGDSYYNYRPGKGQSLVKQTVSKGKQDLPDVCARRGNKIEGLREKNLVGIPWRVALALQADDWILRQDIIWEKPNPMPESVTDRCTKSHEYIFLLTKNPHYYYNNELIKEKGIIPAGTKAAKGSVERAAQKGVNARPPEYKIYDGKRNKRSVWTVNTATFSGAHFAVFPEKLIEPCILAGCPEGGLVFDPFFGAGTVGVVAQKMSCNWIGCELNPEYVTMAKNRTANEARLF